MYDIRFEAQTWSLWLLSLRRGENIEYCREKLLRYLATKPRRRQQVRINLVLAKTAKDPKEAVYFFERAADLLQLFLKKPKLSKSVYAFVGKLHQIPESYWASVTDNQNHEEPRRDDDVLHALTAFSQLFQRSKDDVVLHDLRVRIADKLIEKRADYQSMILRIEALLPILSADDQLLDEVLSALRDRECYDVMVYALRKCIDAKNPQHRRHLSFELGHVLRSALSDLAGAIACFEQIIDTDPSDREAWGELLECLDDSGDEVNLLKAIERRVALTKGLEQEQLTKQRDSLLKRLTGQSAEQSPSL